MHPTHQAGQLNAQTKQRRLEGPDAKGRGCPLGTPGLRPGARPSRHNPWHRTRTSRHLRRHTKLLKTQHSLACAAIKVAGQNQYQPTAGHSLTAGKTRNTKEGWQFGKCSPATTAHEGRHQEKGSKKAFELKSFSNISLVLVQPPGFVGQVGFQKRHPALDEVHQGGFSPKGSATNRARIARACKADLCRSCRLFIGLR